MDGGVKGKYKNPSEMEAKDFVDHVRVWFADSRDGSKKARDSYRKSFKFKNGDQWGDKKEQADNEGFPALTLNYIHGKVETVAGEERKNRTEIKVFARSTEDDGISTAMSSVIRWSDDISGADFNRSYAFKSMVCCGVGWRLREWSYENDPEGRLESAFIPWDCVYSDPASRKQDYSDAKFVIMEKWMTDDEVEALAPGATEALHARRLTSTSDSADWNIKSGTRARTKVYDKKRGEWQVLQVWWKETQTGYVYADPAAKGQLKDMTAAEHQDAITNHQREVLQFESEYQNYQLRTAIGELVEPPQAPQQLPEFSERPVKRVWTAHIIGDEAFNIGQHPVTQCKTFPLIPCFGYWNEEDCHWYGIVTHLLDPQRQHNVEQSTIVRMAQNNSKNGWYGPKGWMEDEDNWLQNSSKPGFVAEYNMEPKQVQPQSIPSFLPALAQSRLQAMSDISMVNYELMGASSAADVGVVNDSRKTQAITGLSTLFDNYRLSKKIEGEIMIHYLQHYLDPGRVMMVLGEDATVSPVQFVEDMKFATYDAVIEEAQWSNDQKGVTLQALINVLPQLQSAQIPIPKTLLPQILPIPAKLRNEWIEHIQQQEQQAQMMQQQQMQVQPQPQIADQQGVMQ